MNKEEFREVLKTLSPGDTLEMPSPLPSLEAVSGEQFVWVLESQSPAESKKFTSSVFNVYWHGVFVTKVEVNGDPEAGGHLYTVMQKGGAA